MDRKTISPVNNHPFRDRGIGSKQTDTGKADSRGLRFPSRATTNHAGGCYCGSIRYLINGEPVIHLYCFCEDCHSITGTDGYHSGYMVKECDFQLVSGTPTTHEELSEEGRIIKRHYCRKCGCELWAQTDLGLLSVSASTLDDSTACHSTKKVFVHDAPDWARVPAESVRQQGLSSQDSPDDDEDTGPEFTAVDLVLEAGPRSHVIRDSEDDTDLEFENVELEFDPGPRNQDFRDGEDDTDLDYESVGKDDRHSLVNFGYRPRHPDFRQKS